MRTPRRIAEASLALLAVVMLGFTPQGSGSCLDAARLRLCLLGPGFKSTVGFMKGVAGLPGQTVNFLASEPLGWVDLLPRESLRGWTRLTVPPGKVLDPINQWSLDKEHGTILCEGNHGHEWLRYDRELANFILHVEWRFEKREGASGYNSGIFIRNDHEGRVWHQAQVGATAYIFGQTLLKGELSSIMKTPPPAENPLHPVGEWNTYEIRCDGAQITLWVNGQAAGVFSAPEVLKGYWGLEAEGYRIEFRNIKLKILP